MSVPTIETPRLTLRAFRHDDFEPYFERILAARPVMRFLSGSGEPRSREEGMLAFARISAADRDPRDRVWAIVERPSNEVIGHAVLQRLDKGDLIEVGYALGEAWWGKGYATEAARATVDFGFGPARLELIVGIARPENLASRRVLEKTGLRYVGMRHYYHVDVAYYEFTRAQHEAAS